MKTIFLGGTMAALALIAAPASAQTVGSVGVATGAVGGAAGAGVSIDAGANVQASTAGQTTLEPGSNLKRATRKSRRDAAGAATGASATADGEASVGARTPDDR